MFRLPFNRRRILSGLLDLVFFTCDRKALRLLAAWLGINRTRLGRTAVIDSISRARYASSARQR